jgi:hypothetical protein
MIEFSILVVRKIFVVALESSKDCHIEGSMMSVIDKARYSDISMSSAAVSDHRVLSSRRRSLETGSASRT